MLAACGVAPSAYAASGTYYLDFAPATTGAVYPYSPGEKTAILSGLMEMYAGYPMGFTLTEPASGDYSTVAFNSPAIGTSEVDHRNVDLNDFAAVNALDGIDFASPGYSPVSEEVVIASINLAGHEIGHLEGLRHHDSFGPIGAGVPSSGAATVPAPDYPGPTSAFLSSSDVQSLTTASAGGFSLAKLTDAPLMVGQRSSQKLTFNTSPNFFTETALTDDPHPDFESAVDLPMVPYILPNLSPPESPEAELDFVAEMISVSGDIDPTGDPELSEPDFYKFFGVAGSRVQIEVLSEIIDMSRIGVDEFDVNIAVWDPDAPATFLYYGDFTNDKGFETTDALMIDLIIPESKAYLIEVFAKDLKSTGDYELFVSQFSVVPEPSSLALLALGGLIAARRRRR